MRERVVLDSIEHNRRITREQDSEFLFHCQRAVLLALKEMEWLTEAQFRFAEGRLKEQRRGSALRCH